MDYVLFTYPDCQHCEDMKAYLKTTSFQGQEFSLVQKEGKMRIREFLSVIKRDEKGGIALPTLVALEAGQTLGVFNRAEELDRWLKSRV
jgi:glutaredoxin